MVREWLKENSELTVDQLRGRLKDGGIEVSASAMKNYWREALNWDTDTN